MFELSDLERFLTVVEYRNFGRAAAALGIAQPALSRVIASLERRLGVALFWRTHRQIELTPAGELLVREARSVVAQARVAERVMRDVPYGAAGHLRLGTLTSARFTILPAAVRKLHENHPDMRITLSQPPPAVALQQVLQGISDMTLVRGPVNLPDRLQREVLRSDPIVVALPAGHRLARQKTVEVAALADEPFVEAARYAAFGYHDVIRAICLEAGFTPRSVAEVDVFDTMVICVAAGSGVALMHDVREDLPIEGVVYRPISPSSTTMELSAIWRKGDTNPVIEPFLVALRAAAQAL